jgi:MFS transporter, CP family, cyanate transporter
VAFAPWGEGGSSQALVRYLGVLLFSAVGGLVPGTLFALAVRVAPDDGAVSTTVGWMQQWSAFGQFVGPPLVAWAAARAGGWHVTWWVTGACALAGMCIASAMSRFLARHPAGGTARPRAAS